MGAFLEMRLRIACVVLLGTALLAGCGSNGESERYLGYLSQLRGVISPQLAVATDVRAVLTPEAVAQLGAPALIATFPQRANAQLLFTPNSSNDDVTSWRSPDGTGLVLRQGVLSRTQAVGGDLMSADLADVLAALAGHADRATRIHRYLDGENHVVAESFICDYARAPDSTSAYFHEIRVTRVDETCYGIDYIFENQYWIAGTGMIVRAVQWISEPAGYVEYERLID